MPRTGSSVCCPFCRAAPFPVPCPVEGLRPENICKSTIWKCSGHRRRVPTHRPATGSSHHHCCSIDAPAHERAETGGNRNGVSVFPINHPFPIWIERGGLQSQTAPWYFMQFAVPAVSFSPVRDATFHGLWPGAGAPFPSPPVLPVSVPAEVRRTCR